MNGYELDRNWLESMSAASYEYGGIAVYHKDDGTNGILECHVIGTEPAEDGFKILTTINEPVTPDELESKIRFGLAAETATAALMQMAENSLKANEGNEG